MRFLVTSALLGLGVLGVTTAASAQTFPNVAAYGSPAPGYPYAVVPPAYVPTTPAPMVTVPSYTTAPVYVVPRYRVWSRGYRGRYWNGYGRHYGYYRR
jgi:hypothetical protein